MVAVITVVAAPVMVTSAAATVTAASPAFGIGANRDLEIEVAGHVAEHVAPDIIEDIEAVVPTIITTMIATPAVSMVIVPWHVKCGRGSRKQDQCGSKCRREQFHCDDLEFI